MGKLTLLNFLTRRQKIIVGCGVFGMILGFIFDNTLAPPIIEYLKTAFGLEKIHLYITGVSVQVISIALGIYLGIIADRWKTGREITDELVKILPLVEFEIRTNYRILQNAPLVGLNKNSFMLDYWIM